MGTTQQARAKETKMRNLYTRHASTLPVHTRDAIASLFGRDALDSRVCDLMTLSEWEDIFDESAPTHADSCYYCDGDVPAYRADHEDTHPCDAIGHRYCDTDRTCYGCGRDASEHAYRAAAFFDQARAAHDDVAANGTLSPTPTVLAERFRLVGGYSESAPERARIVGTYGLGYLVRFVSDGVEALAFPSEIHPLR